MAFLQSLILVLSLTSVEGSNEPESPKISELSAKEYYQAIRFQQAASEPKMKSLSRKQQLSKVAQALHIPVSTLDKAVQKLEAIKEPPEEALKNALFGRAENGRMRGQIIDVLTNNDEPKHVITYIRFKSKGENEIVREAALLAHWVSTEAPWVSTLSLAAIANHTEATEERVVWSAKIGHDAMERIQEKRIEEYGDKLYKGLFENVENKF